LRYPVNPGKWSVFENLAHLVTYQLVFLERIARIQQEQQPQFGRYVADNDPAFAPTVEQSLPTLLGRLVHDREQIIQILENMGAKDMVRTGIHPKYGNMDIPQWTEFFLLHESHHLFTIFMLMAELRTMQR